MPIHEKTYQYAAETAFADVSTAENQADFWAWYIVQLALGRLAYTDQSVAAVASPTGVWTVAGSSDGVTAGMDGVDRWTSTFNAAKIVHASAGSAHSWIVLYNAALGVWLTLDFASASVSQVIPYFAYAAPTGGSVTARPTSTIEVGNGVGVAWFDSTAGSTRKARGVLCTDGTFFASASKDGGSLVNSGFYVLKLADLYAGDPYPVIMGFDSSTSGIWRNASVFATCFYKEFDGTVRSNGAIAVPTVNGGVTMTNGGLAVDRNGLIPRYPPSLVSNPTSYAVKGRIPDFIPCGKGTDDTGTIPGAPPFTDWRIGTLTVPANAAPVL